MLRMMLNDHAWSKLAVILQSEKIHLHPIKTRRFIEPTLSQYILEQGLWNEDVQIFQGEPDTIKVCKCLRR